ncbi:MAG: ABC1 kinase family protein, partial [bacterium]
LTSEIERSTNRLSFSLLIAALIVASSLILVRSELYASYHLLGIGGFLLAAVVGAWLLVNIVRSGRV